MTIKFDISNSYWNYRGRHQEEFEAMSLEPSFEFTKKTNHVFSTYYRYYNDGDIPGWAKGMTSEYIVGKIINGKYRTELNDFGKMELERRVSERIIAEWKRYLKHVI